MQRGLLVAGLLVALAGRAAAQSPRTIDPGMTRAQVIERLGQPAAVRTTGASTYIFYKNGCIRVCGVDDVVILEGDGVVDAIFRSPQRQYTGQSSSPRAVSAAEAAHGRRGVIQAGAPASPDSTVTPPSQTTVSTPAAERKEAAPMPLPAPLPVARPNLAPTHPDDPVTGTIRIKVKSGRTDPDRQPARDGAAPKSPAPPPAAPDTLHRGGSQTPEG